jgi:hypothetical protein
VRRFSRYLPLVFLVFAGLQLASAQSTFDIAIGGGTSFDKTLGAVDINDPFLGTCAPGSSSTCTPTPDLKGFFLGFNGNVMLWKHFGLGMGVQFQPGKQDYLVFSQAVGAQFGDKFQTRTTFYDFNAIFEPISAKRAAFQLIGGIGGANIKFYEKQSSSSILGNSNFTQFVSSANHFQVHGGVGIPLFATEHVFIKPEVDLRYVTNFEQFKRNFVPSVMVWVGYSFGDRQ